MTRVTGIGGVVLNWQDNHAEDGGATVWLLDPEGNKVELWEPKIWDDQNKA